MNRMLPPRKKWLEHLRHYAPLLLMLIVVCLLFDLIVRWRLPDPVDEASDALAEPSSPSFTGNSDQLKSTVMVPTLETAFPPNRSAIWSAASNLAWKELHRLAGGDVMVEGLLELSRQLNRSIHIRPNMDTDDFYAVAGFKSKGIYKQVQQVLTQRFPSFQLPSPPETPRDSILAFRCFKLVMKYRTAFLNDEEPMAYRDSQGNKTKVKSFGIRKKDARYDTMRKQIDTFFHDGQGQYAVDLSTGMQPYQVILASIKRESTLKATLDNFDKITRTNNNRLPFGHDSILSIPNMEWSIDHSYSELIDKVAHAPKLTDPIQITEALQHIEFKMDRTGVTASSSNRFAGSIVNGDEVHRTGHYIFDQPFLIIVRRRTSNDPLFVMWVDNAELLKRW